jgi:hypothetical protein
MAARGHGASPAAQAAGQDAQLLEVDGDHFSLADITSPTWPTVINALEEVMSGR